MDFPVQNNERDAAIRSTDTDAAQARLSAVKKGYLQDEFIQYFVPRARFSAPRPPLINIGTFVRSTVLDTLLERWIDLHDQTQIVSLGAGSDTRFWRLATSERSPKLKHYVELDFPENTARKAQVIRKTESLHRHLGPNVTLAQGGMALHSPRYTLLPVDLRHSPETTLFPLLSSGTLDSSVPLLFISECVFVYMDPQASDAIVQWFGASFDTVGGMLYEMFSLNDGFGKVMRINLMSRNVELPGVDAYPTLEYQRSRFLNHGFSEASALTLKTARRSHITQEQLTRIATLEMLDEIEELDLVLEHYTVAFGSKGVARKWDLPRQDDQPIAEE